MKPIQPYKEEALSKLKHWISEMNSRGTKQYYEIFVDGTKVVHKTNEISEFESYLTWIDDDTQFIRVLTYNTKGSHRAKIYEYRTDKFVPEVDYKEQVAILKTTNEELLKRIADAEEHIGGLEAQLEQQYTKSGFDLEKMISTFGSVAKQYPDLASNFGGFGEIFKTPEKPVDISEDCGFSFKKKSTEPQQEKEEAIPKTNSQQNEKDNSDVFTFSTQGKLSDEHSARMYELMQFFTDNPAYIDVVFELVNQEKGKSAA
jgi:hypothetical protein